MKGSVSHGIGGVTWAVVSVLAALALLVIVAGLWLGIFIVARVVLIFIVG